MPPFLKLSDHDIVEWTKNRFKKRRKSLWNLFTVPVVEGRKNCQFTKGW